ncbi:MAG: serine/threonine protein kinase [Anaerolineae bacterium]|nr:serine/threonine protein kinase [Anaerolineae bacterium]
MAEALEGRDLGKYRDLKKIGEGGMGVVYRAWDVSLHRDVALKVLLPHLATDGSFVRRLQKEARAAARLKHDNIAIVYEVARKDDVRYIAMEYVPGRTLKEIIEEEHALPLRRVVTLFEQLADALSCAHGRGLIHRDVKPGNIIVGDEDHLTLTDFGIARAAEQTGTLVSAARLTGTPSYMSPEQVEGEDLDYRSDIYSMGVVLYQMLTGRVPFKAKTVTSLLYAHVHKKPPRPSSFKRGIPEAVERVVLKALEKKPGNRFQSVAQMAAALREAAEKSRSKGPRGVPAWLSRVPARAVVPVVGVIVLLVALLGPWVNGSDGRVSLVSMWLTQRTPKPTQEATLAPTMTRTQTQPVPSPTNGTVLVLPTSTFTATPTEATATRQPTATLVPGETRTWTPSPEPQTSTPTPTPTPVVPALKPVAPAPEPVVSPPNLAPKLTGPLGECGRCETIKFEWTWDRSLNREADEYYELLVWEDGARSDTPVKKEYAEESHWVGCPGDEGTYHWKVTVVGNDHEQVSPASEVGTFTCTKKCDWKRD